MYNCKYCGKECKNNNSLSNHQRLCKLNPNPKLNSPLAHKRKGTPSWSKGLTKDSNKILAEKSARISKRYKDGELINHQKGKARTKEEKQKISSTMKANPNAGGLRHGSGRGKKGWYNGFFCDSTYELVYVIYNLDHNIKFNRSKLKYQYTYNNELHNYYPDFEMEDGSLVEVKGYYNEQVKAKINTVTDRPIKLLLKKDLQYAFEHVKENYTYDKLEDLYNGIERCGGYPAR